MKTKRTLALILGATILSGTMCQTTMQAYACPTDDTTSSVSSNVKEDIQIPKLTRLENPEIISFLQEPENISFLQWVANDIGIHFNLDNLFVSDNNLVFFPISETEVKAVFLPNFHVYGDSARKTIIPKKVSIDGKDYTVKGYSSIASE